MKTTFIELREQGLYCPQGDFFIDPWKPVNRALITHAHSDHARWGCGSYLLASEGVLVARTRLGAEVRIETLPYGSPILHQGVRISFHPAGHILGSAQIRLEFRGQVIVIAGDYKREPDPTCTPFEPVRCHIFLTESTFGLPIYRWRPSAEIMAEVLAWWRENQHQGKASIIHGYALGKAQRILAGLPEIPGPIYTHGAVEKINADYRTTGVVLPPTKPVAEAPPRTDWGLSLIVAPPSAHGTAWMRKFKTCSTAFVSGWMAIRGTRRRRAIDRGFVLSDHVDWPDLCQTIQDTGAETVWVTHGYSAVVVRWLREHGLDAAVLPTRYVGDEEEQPGDLED